MQSTFKFTQPISKQSLIQMIVLSLFIVWTFFLGLETWKIQHSCQPMIETPKALSGNSQGLKFNNMWDTAKKDLLKFPPSTGKFFNEINTTKVQSDPRQAQCASQNQEEKISPYLLGIATASIAAVGLAILGVPVAVVAGVSAATGLILSSAITFINNN